MLDTIRPRNRLFVCWILFCCIILSVTQVSAQELDTSITDRIDAHVERFMDMLGIPGVAVAIVQGDQVVYLQSYGIADDAGREMTPKTPVIIASLSKSFTGMAVQQLVEAGQISINTPVSEILNWFPHDAIRLSHLLYQTSGFTALSGQSYLADNLRDADALETSMRRTAADYPPVREPGVGFEYSNTNYDLLGLVVQVVSGQSYEDYIQENIFDPLEMTDSYTSLEAARQNGLSQGYLPYFGQSRAVENPLYSRGHIASAGIISTAEDMAHYHIAVLNGGRYRDAAVLSEEGTIALHTPGHMLGTWNGYGMGWWRYPFWSGIEDESLYSSTVPYVLDHSGTANGFTSHQFLVPERQQAIIILSNAHDPTRVSLYYNLPHGIAEILNGSSEAAFIPASDDFLTQNGHVVFWVLLVVWVIMALIALQWIVARWRNPMTLPRSRFFGMLIVLIPAVLDIGLVFLMLSAPALVDTTMSVLFAYLSETRILIPGLLAVAAGWGTLRTVLFLWLWLRRSPAQPEAALSQ